MKLFILFFLFITINSQITVLGPNEIIEKVKQLDDGSKNIILY